MESKQSKEKKVCNLYPFSWRNLCFTFESFLLGVNVENNHKFCGLQNRNCNPFLRWRLLWSLWKNSFSFYHHQWFSFPPLLSRIRICTVYLDIFCMYVNKCCFEMQYFHHFERNLRHFMAEFTCLLNRSIMA